MQVVPSIGQLDFVLEICRDGAGMQGILHYNTDLFDRATAQRLLGHFLVNCLQFASLCNDRLREASHDFSEQGFSLCEGCGNTLS